MKIYQITEEELQQLVVAAIRKGVSLGINCLDREQGFYITEQLLTLSAHAVIRKLTVIPVEGKEECSSCLGYGKRIMGNELAECPTCDGLGYK